MNSKYFFEKGSIWESKFGDNQQFIVVAKGKKQVTSMALDGSTKEQLKHWKFVLYYSPVGNIL